MRAWDDVLAGGLLAAAVLLLATASPAEAGCQGTNFNFCSKTFYASAPCDGQDQLASIGDNHCATDAISCLYCAKGKNCPLIKAWEPTEITIVGVEITIFEGSGALNYAYAGNGYHPNQMAFVGAGQSHTRQFFPPGTGFKLAPSSPKGYIDLHISCRPKAAAHIQAFYTVYYTVPEPVRSRE